MRDIPLGCNTSLAWNASIVVYSLQCSLEQDIAVYAYTHNSLAIRAVARNLFGRRQSGGNCKYTSALHDRNFFKEHRMGQRKP